jgi:hypothetical protein
MILCRKSRFLSSDEFLRRTSVTNVIHSVAEVGQNPGIQVLAREKQVLQSAQLGYGFASRRETVTAPGDPHFIAPASPIITGIISGTASECRISEEQYP